MRSLGDELVTEPSNAAALARRSKKPAERQDKETLIQQKDGSVKTIRRRFGRSVGRRSPGGYQAELRKKFGAGYHEAPAMTYRASQYDPFLDRYVKKKLSDRWYTLHDGRKIQRDIMSAFLMYCASSNFETIDRRLCLERFGRFWELHQDCILDLKRRHCSICNSGIRAV